jgi:hypothetical protein
MTASSPSNIIDYRSYRRNKRSALCLSIQSPAEPSFQQIQMLNESCCIHKADAVADFNGQLRALENSARHQFIKIYKTLSPAPLPGWLAQLLAERILPTLRRIGFEPAISKMLFEMGSSAWQSLAPANHKIIPFQPQIDCEIEAIRQGFKLKRDGNSNSFPPSTAKSAAFMSGSLQENKFPENLFNTLTEIATPWIILPRAFRFLEIDQCRYLPVYVKTMDTETQESCLNVFSRITIEFLGNFSLKFADQRYPANLIAQLIFYGYAALFWKTLRCPPKNLENSAVFDHFFIWLKRFVRQNNILSQAENSLMAQMVKMRTRAFPALKTHSYRNGQHPDSSRFLVTLRHGSPGIAATLRYFGIDQFLKTRRTGTRFTCLSFQKELHCLLYKIRTKYHSEAKPTQENIQHFINWIKAACDNEQPDFDRTQKQFVDRLLNHMQKFVNS